MSLRSANAASCRALKASALRKPTAAPRRFASGGSKYNQPTGYIFGEKPPPAGQKRQKQDWESLWTWGMFGGMAFAGVLLAYKPDTSVQTWAMAEAKKRLESSGEAWQYKPSPYTVAGQQQAE